jgi:hypothetical protein
MLKGLPLFSVQSLNYPSKTRKLAPAQYTEYPQYYKENSGLGQIRVRRGAGWVVFLLRHRAIKKGALSALITFAALERRFAAAQSWRQAAARSHAALPAHHAAHTAHHLLHTAFLTDLLKHLGHLLVLF